MIKEPRFSVGIEEEYLLVDPETGDVVREAVPGLFAECEQILKAQVTTEFLQSQIEIGTHVCTSMQEARDDLTYLRKTVSGVAQKHGVAIIAVSSHPFAAWSTQKHTEKERAKLLAEDMQMVARRMMINGVHVHVEIGDPELRIDMMGQAAYILPHLLALSTSSPFWEGYDTGLKSYRIAVWNECPRTGLPELFRSFAEYQRHVDVLVNAGVIQDGTKIWWDIRPSARYPTLEMRIADICTRVDDGVCIASLYRCWLRMLYRLRVRNQRWREYANMLLEENRWRAQRYGYEKGLLDFGRGEVVPYAQLLEELLELIREDAEYFGCVREVEHARSILQNGTSAHRQLKTYYDAKAAGASNPEALKAVVHGLIEDTLYGL